jgi:ribonuclease VapC
VIVIDTSALVAIFYKEPDALVFEDRIAADNEPVISAGTLLECSIVFRTLGQRRGRLSASDADLDDFLAASNVTIRPVTDTQIAIARDAHRRYGKGMGHPAQLNFGDCFSYALAKSLNVPLLYKGGDFAQTDIASAI